ncbi:helix-turn-helix transcriptional regulator [Flavihumibacter sp. UBA7668]|uniref:helix-turn-helix transcriptional regulator n=1 Tax=Flavihumibacter sp. UBA7668 TaxID=1946542 RepID=UPI0039C8979A
MTAYRLAKDIGIPQTRFSEIIKGNRRITADTALRFSKYFGNSAKLSLPSIPVALLHIPV